MTNETATAFRTADEILRKAFADAAYALNEARGSECYDEAEQTDLDALVDAYDLATTPTWTGDETSVRDAAERLASDFAALSRGIVDFLDKAERERSARARAEREAAGDTADEPWTDEQLREALAAIG